MYTVTSLIGQDGGGGFNLIWVLLPLLCCMMSMSRRGERAPEPKKEIEVFYTTQDIATSFGKVEEEVDKWRSEAEEEDEEPGGILYSVRKLLGGGAPPERLVEREKNPPRLYSLRDPKGPINFEFNDVEGENTVVKVTYSTSFTDKVAKLKAGIPIVVPANPIGPRCPACGKPSLQEFNQCSYCGTELIKAEKGQNSEKGAV
jgi:hypothetical protein